MNGQPYSYSASNSGNGTPTPSSNSYPASLSSHSSRDTSPSRLHGNLNHINSEKSAPLPNNYPPSYKSHYDSNVNSVYQTNHSDINTTGNCYPNNSMFPNSESPVNSPSKQTQGQTRPPAPAQPLPNSQILQNKPQTMSVQSQNILNQKQFNSYLSNSRSDSLNDFPVENSSSSLPQATGNVLNKNMSYGQNPLSYSHLANTRQESFLSNSSSNKGDQYQMQNFNQSNLKSNLPPSNEPLSNATSLQSLNYQSNSNSSTDGYSKTSQQPLYQNPYPQSSPSLLEGYGPRLATSGQILPPPPAKTQEEPPLSSGPPRTNVLGIIPYSTDSVSTMSQVPSGTTKTVTAQGQNLKPQVLTNPSAQPAGAYNSYNSPPAPASAAYSHQPSVTLSQPSNPPFNSPSSLSYNYSSTTAYNQPTSYPSTATSYPTTGTSYTSTADSYSQPTLAGNPPTSAPSLHQQGPYSQPPYGQQQTYSQSQLFNSQSGVVSSQPLPYSQPNTPLYDSSYNQTTPNLPTSVAGSNRQIPASRQPMVPPLPTSRGQPPTSQLPPGVPMKGYPGQYSSSRPPDAAYGSPPPNQPYSYQQNNISGYPQTQYGGGYYPGGDDLANEMGQMNITQWGYNKLWQGREAVDLLKTRDILPPTKVDPPPIFLKHEYNESPNCSPDIFRCTLTRIPETKSLLDKSRLPLGVLIHPFMDLHKLSVITCNAIVRCHGCRTYINPFVYFVELKKWKCNLCFRKNDLPDEFQFDPDSKTYGDPTRRPEIKSATIEFIAPSEYMVRPPQPAAYVFVIDVSRLGSEAGYLQVFCETLLAQLEDLPGDSRTSVGFITFDSIVHYYSLAETQSQPHQMVVVDIDDMFVPCPENLLVNLGECFGLVKDLLNGLPNMYKEAHDTGSALGPALQAAYKLLAPTGGRITVFQSCLASRGPGSLQNREDPAQRSAENVTQEMLNPVTDFYKKLALDCSGQQIAVDLFILNSQYVDLASLSGIAKFSGGCIHHFPLFNAKNPKHVVSLQGCLSRYLSRKIGFESVMRLRCTRGLSIHSFHGNFFVRSTDLLSLPNINPDAGFGMQVSIDENLSDIQNVCFQAALLYTSSKGERRIRVHTLCLPIATNLSDVLHSADQQCIAGLLAKMAVDRCHQSSLGDAREAFVNVVADVLSVFRITQSSNPPTSLLAPSGLRLLPLYIHALLKYIAFRTGQSTRIDDRVFAMCQMKTLPLGQLIQTIYPDLYPIYSLQECETKAIGNEQVVVQPPRLHLSAERIDSQGIYLMDDGESLMIYIGHNCSPALISSYFGVPSFNAINSSIMELPELDNPDSKLLRGFVTYLQNEKPVPPSLHIIRDDNAQRQVFFEKLVEDKTESGPSYYEFLQRIKQMVK